MNKLLIFAGFIGTIFLILFFVYKEGEKKGTVTEVKKQQETEIKVQNEVIKEKKKVIRRKVIAKSVSTNDNLNWLRQNRCKDCKGR